MSHWTKMCYTIPSKAKRYRSPKCFETIRKSMIRVDDQRSGLERESPAILRTTIWINTSAGEGGHAETGMRLQVRKAVSSLSPSSMLSSSASSSSLEAKTRQEVISS